ncbi:sensor histidine kinase [Agaricicola taiwanensis]|uniref:sensor histidine kinase n=1 Tax=Agaricicola taiwanensis TaxID=591372 RepID=UPI001E31148D|nr:ATP-binding protein [Agaricicola taiwanensis]
MIQRLQTFVTGLVHESVSAGRPEAVRHRSFIAAHLAAGVTALAALPLYLALRGAPTAPEAMAFAALLLPLLVAFDLSRTGKMVRAHILSAVSVALLVFPVAVATGGIMSFAVPWLIIIPLETAFSGSRKAIGAGVVSALVVAVALVGIDLAGWLPASALSPQAAKSMLFASGALAALYAALLAVRANNISRLSMEDTRRGEARYRLLAEHMHDLITRHTRSGNVTFASPAATRITGAEPAALMGQGLFDRVHIADRPSYLTALSTTATTGTETSVRFRLRRDSPAAGLTPDWCWVEMRCALIEDDTLIEDEGGRHVVSVTRDIEERVAHEAELLAAREEADRASMAKTHFLANISHELRTPLNAIIGFSEMLSTSDMPRMSDERQMEYAKLIHESGLHLLAVVNSILDMSRIESGNFSITPEPFELMPLIDTSRQLFTLKAAQAQVRLEVDIEEGLPDVYGDCRACRQILINLLSNALKFTPAGGTVTISARRNGGFATLSVADTGIGVSPEDLSRLGEPFYQARSSYNRPYEGTGLGLSVVKGLVSLHGGIFKIESRVGEGTVVTIELPTESTSVTPVPAKAPADHQPVDGDLPARLTA